MLNVFIKDHIPLLLLNAAQLLVIRNSYRNVAVETEFPS